MAGEDARAYEKRIVNLLAENGAGSTALLPGGSKCGWLLSSCVLTPYH